MDISTPGHPSKRVKREPDAVSEVSHSSLCTICQDIFGRTKNKYRMFFWYHDIHGLIESAAKGCHFCVQVLRDIRPEDVETLKREFVELDDKQSRSCPVEKRLKVETRYHEHLGVSFLLQRSKWGGHDLLAAESLWFDRDFSEISTTSTGLQSTGDQRSLDQIHRWMRQCTVEHVACQSSTEGSPSNQWPSRLLSVRREGDTYINLCETSKLVCSKLHYATLSHCWGNFVPLQLLNENIAEFLDEIRLKSLPKTFREAVEMTRSLGLSYLWIDSLCILQDSLEDWAVESNRMYGIYKNSYINLAAVASSNAKGGLVCSGSLQYRIPCRIRIGSADSKEEATMLYTPLTQRNSNEIPLLSRAWVFQEILLPSRVLLFTKDEVYWECNAVTRTEAYPEAEPRQPTSEGGKAKLNQVSVIPFRKIWREISEKSTSSRFDLWNQVIVQYSEKERSHSADKLVAVAGLADDLGQAWPDADYLAGLWSYDLLHGLLWKAESCTRSRFYNAPSWSWASVDGAITTHSHEDRRFCDALVEVLEARTSHSRPSMVYGAVTDGYIRLKGPLLQAQIRKRGTVRDLHTIRFLDECLSESIDHWFRVEISAHVIWDNGGLAQICRVTDAFLMPLEISITKSATTLCLQGIILSRIQSQKGEYQRIGWFEVEDQPHKPVESDMQPFSNHVCSQDFKMRAETPGSVVVDSEKKDYETPSVTSIDELHDPSSVNGSLQQSLDDETHSVASTEALDSLADVDESPQESLFDHKVELRTVEFEIIQVIERANREEEQIPKLPELVPLSKRPDMVTKPSSGDHLGEDDKFCNGLVDMTLGSRYEGQLDDEDYLNINSLLFYVKLHFELFFQRNSNTWERDQYYEISHGDGIFTVRIV